MKTKTVLFALALTLVFTSCVRAQQSQQYDSEGDFLYEIRDGKVIITEYVGTKQEICIPPQIRRTPVTEIGKEAFSKMYITSVTIPNSVTTIGENAFTNNQLTSVVIPDRVTAIGNYAFAGNRLTSVIIPDRVTIIEAGTFGANRLTSVVIPNSVTAIGDDAFGGNHLTSVTIPDSVTSIGEYAFSYNRLTSVSIGNGVTTIGKRAFAENRLTSVTIPNSVTLIGQNVFDVIFSDGSRISNPPTSITIGANVIFPDTSRDSFAQSYNAQGRRAGTYTISNNRWSLN